MKNLAICFSGAIRSFHLCHESIKKNVIIPLQSEYNVYLFGHFWIMKEENKLNNLTYRMKWKKDADSSYELLKAFGFTDYVMEEYSAEKEKMILKGLGGYINSETDNNSTASNSSTSSLPPSSPPSSPHSVGNILPSAKNTNNKTVITQKGNTISIKIQKTQNPDNKQQRASLTEGATGSTTVKTVNLRSYLNQKSSEHNLVSQRHRYNVSAPNKFIQLSDAILQAYSKIEDPEKKSQYMNYAVNSMGMYYKIMMANRLKENWSIRKNVKFDYTIRMRPDFYWNEPIPAKVFENITDQDIVLVYDNYCTHAKWEGNDKFFGGTSAMMNKYCNLYREFAGFFSANVRIEGQELARAMIKKLQLKIKFFGHEGTYSKCAGPLWRRLEKEQAKKKRKQMDVVCNN
jgi:hypothetical protein